jgi:hypothetical protein
METNFCLYYLYFNSKIWFDEGCLILVSIRIDLNLLIYNILTTVNNWFKNWIKKQILNKYFKKLSIRMATNFCVHDLLFYLKIWFDKGCRILVLIRIDVNLLNNNILTPVKNWIKNLNKNIIIELIF